MGILAWHGNPNWSDTFNLTRTGQFKDVDNWTTPTTLTDFGTVLWKLAHAPPNLGAFTGSYAASRCPSAQ